MLNEDPHTLLGNTRLVFVVVGDRIAYRRERVTQNNTKDMSTCLGSILESIRNISAYNKEEKPKQQTMDLANNTEKEDN